MLQKCYKELYSAKTLRQPGTLYNFKCKPQRTDVNGKVKGAFKSHNDFLLLVGKSMIVEQFWNTLEWKTVLTLNKPGGKHSTPTEE